MFDSDNDEHYPLKMEVEELDAREEALRDTHGIVITGYWDDEPIWRLQSAEERLQKALKHHD